MDQPGLSTLLTGLVIGIFKIAKYIHGPKAEPGIDKKEHRGNK